MIEPRRTTPTEDHRAREAHSPAPEDFEALRHLLLKPEKEQIDDLRQQVEDSQVTADGVSSVLAEAVRIRSANDDALGEALGPTIGNAFNASIKKDPRTIADAISPIMGPAIRQSIVNTIRGMVQSLNRTLEHSLSWQGLKWRIEAKRTGKQFAEVVLLKTLIYQVEQVFLIHRETGLLMQHVGVDTATVKDTDLVSGMLTAIRDFVKESFGGKDEDALHAMRVGQHTVWIEQGSKAVLAVVISGEAPMELRTILKETLESIEVEHRDAISNFEGDNTPFEATRDRLEQCLQSQFREGSKSKFPTKAVVVLVLLLAAIFGGLGYWMYLNIEERRRWNDYVDLLNKEPGIVVTEMEKRGGVYHVEGLRDPLAESPEKVFDSTGLDRARLDERWELYQSPERPFVLHRLKQVMEPPNSVEMELKQGVLRLTGTANHDWITDAKKAALSMTGVVEVDTADLQDADQHFADFIQQLNSEPGILVTSSEKREGNYKIVGLLDPLATKPGSILEATQLDPSTIELAWKPYQSFESEIMLRRVRQMLAPPESVQLKIEGDTLHLSGAASHRWISDTVLVARAAAGISSIDVSDLIDLDLQAIEKLKKEIKDQRIYFLPGAAGGIRPDSQPAVKALADKLTRLFSTSRIVGKRYRLRIIGHAAAANTGEDLQAISAIRADYLKENLVALGIPEELLYSKAAGSSQPERPGVSEEELAASRRATFEIIDMDE